MMISADSENKTIILSTNLDQNLYLNTEYTSLFKIEIQDKKPCTPKDIVTVSYNISKDGLLIKEDSFSKEIGCTSSASTGNFIPSEVGKYSLCGVIANSSINTFSSLPSCTEFEVMSTTDISCDVSLQLKTNQTLFYDNEQSIKFKPELNNRSFPFVTEYWIEDLFGNIIKPKVNTTNTNEKSWKTNIDEEDRVLFVKAILYPSCNDSDQSNNAAEKMFIVLNNSSLLPASDAEETPENNAYINITSLSPENPSFGETINVEIEIYKNATDKYSVSLWVEKDEKTISEKTKLHLKSKNTLYKMVVPVQIDANCESKIDSGTIQLVIEGLGLREQEEFSLGGLNEELCKKADSKQKKEDEKSKNKPNSFRILDLPGQIFPGEAFRVEVEIQNSEDADFEAWSYLYRGSKCYSCASGEREDNKISFSVVEDEPETAELLVKTDSGLEEGEYNLMVKYKKESQKNAKSLVSKIYLATSEEETKTVNQSFSVLSVGSSESALTAQKTPLTEIPNYPGIVVYESNSERSKNMISWILVIAFGLLSLVLIWKR